MLKKSFLSLAVVTVVFASLGFSLLSSTPAFASATVTYKTPTEGGNVDGQLFVKVSPGNLGSKVTVIACRKTILNCANPISLKYVASQDDYESGDVFATSDSGQSCSIPNSTNQQTATFDVKMTGQYTDSINNIDICSKYAYITFTEGSAPTTGTIAGTVKYPYENNQQDIRNCPDGNIVTVTDSNNNKVDTPAISHGTYDTKALSPGKYTVSVHCMIQGVGYYDGQVSATVTAGNVATGNILASTNPNNPTGATSPPSTAPTCDASCQFDQSCSQSSKSFAWIICPAIGTINDVLNWLFQNIIQPALKVTPLTPGSGDLYNVWSAMRNLANVFFVLIFMLIVVGNVLSLENYTIKKVLPRLVAAAILVQFSFLFCGLLVDISNVLGSGIQSLIFSVLGPSGSGTSGVQDIVSNFAVFGAGILAVTAAIAAGAAPLIISLLVPLVIGVIALVFTLILRLILIDVLVISAPLAFIAWVLPNTEKLFRTWYTNFVRVLLMYPMIMLLIGAGYVVSRTVDYKSQNAFQIIITLLAPTVAFMMVPMTIKWAGGLMGALGNIVSRTGGKASSGITQSDAMKRAKERGAIQRRNLAAGQGVSYFGRTIGAGRAGQLLGKVATGDLQGHRTMAGFTTNLAKADKTLTDNRFKDNAEAMNLLSMTDTEFAKIKEKGTDEQKALVPQVEHLRRDSSIRAAAAIQYGQMGGDADIIRDRIAMNNGTGNEGQAVWRSVGGANKDSRPDLMFTNLATGQVDGQKFLSYMKGRNQAQQANVKADAWKALSGSVAHPTIVSELGESNLGALLNGPGARADAASASVISGILAGVGSGPSSPVPGTSGSTEPPDINAINENLANWSSPSTGSSSSTIVTPGSPDYTPPSSSDLPKPPSS